MLDAVRPDAFDAAAIEGWEADPVGTCERLFPGSSDLVRRYGLRIDRKPGLSGEHLGWAEVGYDPKHDFGTFLAELRRLDAEDNEAAVRARICTY